MIMFFFKINFQKSLGHDILQDENQIFKMSGSPANNFLYILNFTIDNGHDVSRPTIDRRNVLFIYFLAKLMTLMN